MATIIPTLTITQIMTGIFQYTYVWSDMMASGSVPGDVGAPIQCGDIFNYPAAQGPEVISTLPAQVVWESSLDGATGWQQVGGLGNLAGLQWLPGPNAGTWFRPHVISGVPGGLTTFPFVCFRAYK